MCKKKSFGSVLTRGNGEARKGDVDRAAKCVDPEGSAFALWEGGSHIGAARMYELHTVAKMKGLGAEEIAPALDAPGVGTMAILADPQGAGFCLITPKM